VVLDDEDFHCPAPGREESLPRVMNSPFVQLLVRWLVMALGVILATRLVDGISYDNGTTLLVVVLLLSFFNAILKPLLLLFTLPFILMTLGLGIILINALLFLWVGNLVDGFVVVDFWAAAKGAIVVSLTNLIVSGLVGKPRQRERRTPPPPPAAPAAKRPKDDDVIDI
jgi:putative membrane protein